MGARRGLFSQPPSSCHLLKAGVFSMIPQLHFVSCIENYIIVVWSEKPLKKYTDMVEHRELVLSRLILSRLILQVIVTRDGIKKHPADANYQRHF